MPKNWIVGSNRSDETPKPLDSFVLWEESVIYFYKTLIEFGEKCDNTNPEKVGTEESFASLLYKVIKKFGEDLNESTGITIQISDKNGVINVFWVMPLEEYLLLESLELEGSEGFNV